MSVNAIVLRKHARYAYHLTTGSGVSEIVAINDHRFLVDERDGNGLGAGNSASVKQLFRIDLTGATDVTVLGSSTADQTAVSPSTRCMSPTTTILFLALPARIIFTCSRSPMPIWAPLMRHRISLRFRNRKAMRYAERIGSVGFRYRRRKQKQVGAV